MRRVTFAEQMAVTSRRYAIRHTKTGMWLTKDGAWTMKIDSSVRFAFMTTALAAGCLEFHLLTEDFEVVRVLNP